MLAFLNTDGSLTINEQIVDIEKGSGVEVLYTVGEPIRLRVIGRGRVMEEDASPHA